MPSAASSANARWMASRPQNSTAIQKSPGVALSRTPRSGSRAKANSTRTSRAKGAIWLSTTRERHSRRRSLPAIEPGVTEHRAPPRRPSAAVAGTSVRRRHRRRVRSPVVGRRRRRPPPMVPPTMVTGGRPGPRPARARGTRSAPWRPGPRPRGPGRRTGRGRSWSSPAWGSSSSQQLGAADQQHRDRGPAALAGRQPATPATSRSRPSSPRRARAASASSLPARTARAQKRTLSATVRSS